MEYRVMKGEIPVCETILDTSAEQPIDLDEVAYYAPTYWDNMKDTIETYGKLDGENAFIFAERDPIYYNWVTLIRKDWLDQVGLDVPTSNEELKTAMQAFKDAGLGVENAPLITKSFTYFYNWIKDGTSEDELAKYLDLNVAKNMPGSAGQIFHVIFMAFVIIYYVLFLYVYPILARFYNTIRNTIKNALFMAIRHLPYTVVMVLIGLCPLLLLFIGSYQIQSTLFALFLVMGFGVIAYCNSFFLVKIFDHYMPKEENEEQKSEGTEV